MSNSTLAPSATGQMNWLIIAYNTAAPMQPVWYHIGGQLINIVDGKRVNITLQPDSVRVKPEALLDIAYFLEQRVIGPDPFSNEFIAPQPFILAVLITNNGYGSANNFRISSGQPTIVDNDNGLAINFRIISMRLNREQRQQVELSESLGDRLPLPTSTITWNLLASITACCLTRYSTRSIQR
jgi:hypothetical protein